MNELSVNFEEQTISARELHERLNINTRFNDWFSRMCEYGFEEERDFYSKLSKTSEAGGRPQTDYDIKIDMAKEICMIQRTPEGKKVREYLIGLEKAWNTPELIMARALKMADRQITDLKEENTTLARENEELLEENSRYIEEWERNRPIVEYYEDLSHKKAKGIKITDVANEMGISGKELARILREKGILKGKDKDSKYKDWNRPYQKYIDKGYLDWLPAKTITNRFGELERKYQPFIKPAGVPFVRSIYEDYKNQYQQMTLNLI